VAAGVIEDAQATMDEGDIDDGAVGADGAIAETTAPVWAAVLDGIVEDVEPGFGNGEERRREV